MWWNMRVDGCEVLKGAMFMRRCATTNIGYVHKTAGFICYTRSNDVVKQAYFKKRDFDKGIGTIMDSPEVLGKCFYSEKTKDKVKCVGCCYRNICG